MTSDRTPQGGIADYFKFAERGTTIQTEAKAGLTTFLVMAYILFLNPAILSNMFGAPVYWAIWRKTTWPRSSIPEAATVKIWIPRWAASRGSEHARST